MTNYEVLSLTISAFGYGVVAISIFYAARTFRLNRTSLEREIIKDTRKHLEEVRISINEFYSNCEPSILHESSSSGGDVQDSAIRELLNLLEMAQIVPVDDFYNKEMVEDFFQLESYRAFERFGEYIQSTRERVFNPEIWVNVELAAEKYNKKIQSDAATPRR